MSVMIADPKIFDHIADKLWSYTFNGTVNINFSSVARKHFDGKEDRLKQFVKNLCILNEKSYCAKYKEQKNNDCFMFIPLKLRTPVINTYQLLKYLEFIQYNIEISTIGEHCIEEQEAIDYHILCQLINEIRKRIIEELPQYKETKWSDPI